jgi:hypothetical protein
VRLGIPGRGVDLPLDDVPPIPGMPRVPCRGVLTTLGLCVAAPNPGEIDGRLFEKLIPADAGVSGRVSIFVALLTRVT